MKTIFLDFETTGLDVSKDRIVSIGTVIKNGKKTEKKHRIINPGIPIPEEAVSVHGITNEQAEKEGVPFKKIAKSFADILKGDDVTIVGYNILSYDLPLLYYELERSGVDANFLSGVKVVDLYLVFKNIMPRTLEGAVKFFTGEDMEDSHNSLEDSIACMFVLKQVMRQRDYAVETPDFKDIDSLIDFSLDGLKRADVTGKFMIDADGDYILNFGANKGKKAFVCKDYLSWMVKSNFPDPAIEICKSVLKK